MAKHSLLKNYRMKRLAVIMSIYKNNNLLFLKEAVDSILSQTYTLFDFYIIADGILPDELYEYLENLNDSRVILIKRNENKGLDYSLNELITKVLALNYVYVARMDGDDISLPNRFEKQVNFLDLNPEVDVVGTYAIEIDAEGNEFFKKKMPISHQECRDFFIARDCLIHPTVMFRKSYFEKAGLYPLDTFFAGDTRMWQEGFKNNCIFSNLPEYLFYFRLDSNFFNRRKGWSYAKGMYNLRVQITKDLNYGILGYLYAILYSAAIMMPKFLLNIIYKRAR